MAACPLNHLITLENFFEEALHSPFRELRQDKTVACEIEGISALGGYRNVFSKECVDKVMKSSVRLSKASGADLKGSLPIMMIQRVHFSLKLLDASCTKKIVRWLTAPSTPPPLIVRIIVCRFRFRFRFKLLNDCDFVCKTTEFPFVCNALP